MTFSYNPNLPNPPDDPADDVGQMQVNSASISSLIAVDHVGFNLAGGGQHNQVTFHANNVPAVPTSPPVLFTDAPSNHGATPSYPQLFFYSGNSTQGSSQYIFPPSNNGSGSTMLFGGIILKWGTFSINNGTSATTVNFVSNFPNAIFTVNITVSTATASGDFFIGAFTTTTSSFNAGRSGTSGTANYFYVAIGN